ncbi:hypothetical protein ACB092_04G161000 [Castanea dentata]
MIGFFGSLEIETRMGEKEVSYAGFQFANGRDFFFFWRKEKGWIFVLEEGEGKLWRKEKGSAFCLSTVEIGDLESRFGLWHSIVKGKGKVGFKKKLYYVFFLIMLTWKTV